MTCGGTRDEWMDIEDIRATLGLSRSRAYTISRDRTFPEPAIVRPKFRVWRRDDVERWLDQFRPGWRESQLDSG